VPLPRVCIFFTSVLRGCSVADVAVLGQGIKKQGIKEHVKVRKKHDSAGVGVVRLKQ